jgi:hypothetical protein
VAHDEEPTQEGSLNAGKGIAGHGGNDVPEVKAIELQLTREVRFLAAMVDAKRLPDGNALIEIVDPGSATVYHAVITGEAAREIGRKLISTVPVVGADDMPGVGT